MGGRGVGKTMCGMGDRVAMVRTWCSELVRVSSDASGKVNDGKVKSGFAIPGGRAYRRALVAWQWGMMRVRCLGGPGGEERSVMRALVIVVRLGREGWR